MSRPIVEKFSSSPTEQDNGNDIGVLRGSGGQREHGGEEGMKEGWVGAAHLLGCSVFVHPTQQFTVATHLDFMTDETSGGGG